MAAWEGSARGAEKRGARETLREKFPQLQFPIAAGMSESKAYRAATRHGTAPLVADPLVLEEPGMSSFFLHPTAAGSLPVLAAIVPVWDALVEMA